MNKDAIAKLYELQQQFCHELNKPPECTAKQMVMQTNRTLYRPWSKLNEDWVCDICEKDIQNDDEVKFHCKQVRHANCMP